MKFTLLFCVSFCLSLISFAQNQSYNNIKVKKDTLQKYDNNINIKTLPVEKYVNNGNKLKVSLLNDDLFVTDKDQLVPVTSIMALDSLVKKLPNPETLLIEFESTDAQPEKIRSVETVLRQCHCHIIKKSINHFKQ